MAALSWNEIRDRALKFSREWAAASREDSEAKSFWDAFFEVFGKARRTVAAFEDPVRNLKGQYGFIDLLWRGVLVVEHKSRGKDLAKAHTQAVNYIQDLEREGRGIEVPRYLLVSDFARFALHDLEEGTTDEFPLADLHKHIRAFAFVKGEKPVRVDPEDPANIKAAEIMGGLHDALKAGGYAGAPLERFLVRVLFCLFAEDTGIFEPCAFTSYLERRTAEDGADLGVHLARLFEILDTPPGFRQKNLDEDLAVFPYVNGQLFRERLPFADFNRAMRTALVACTHFNWGRINPAVFGSLFQSVMEPGERRQIGAHYTSERDILKVIRSLFLDDLKAELEQIKADRSTRRKTRLEEFHDKLARLTFLDPACGCGNFLVLTYRELRLLETEVLKLLHSAQGNLDIAALARVSVNQMYGIELLEWPARIAEVALWLMDHQMNQVLGEALGNYFVRLPLESTPHIHCGNALRMDWSEVITPAKCSYILGNPPFCGKKEQNADQKADMAIIFQDVKGAGVLDFVCAWYIKAAQFIQGTTIQVALVSTNSITQGEQVGILWNELLHRYGMKIRFAHHTFAWESEARGKAHVHVVIVGFAGFEPTSRRVFSYENQKGDPTESAAKNINPYLADAPDVILLKRGTQISGGPGISYGSMANDRKKTDKGLGNLILDATSKEELLSESKDVASFIRPFVGSEEFLNRTERWCLWLLDCPPELIHRSPLLRTRIDAVRAARQESGREATRKLAKTPQLFGEIRQPDTPYLLLPKVSSESRSYMPIGFLEPHIIANGSALIIPGATRFHFGVLSSALHIAWMRSTCGRMKSDYQYSSTIVYNNFPWPQKVSGKLEVAVEEAAQRVLDVRKEFPGSTLADLYDPVAMPPKLAKAHAALDKAVDRCYRKEPFRSDRERVQHLFALYEALATKSAQPLSRR
jgi:hypothetical protein